MKIYLWMSHTVQTLPGTSFSLLWCMVLLVGAGTPCLNTRRASCCTSSGHYPVQEMQSLMV
ncbi:hypothetical protein GQ600_15281 [Phytophthora cactorum]|nr:hypothetical protein GQ600_15281 [Phytophthora cactorum]